ncbi:MAG: hypothetical protein ACYS8W_11495 [Planctomycetota bacterium]|jgi:hypothetical protein
MDNYTWTFPGDRAEEKFTAELEPIKLPFRTEVKKATFTPAEIGEKPQPVKRPVQRTAKKPAAKVEEKKEGKTEKKQEKKEKAEDEGWR